MRIALRTEGNHRMGMGDLMGSLALAEAFARDGDETLLVFSPSREAEAAVRAAGYPFQCVDSDDAACVALERFQPDVIVVNKLQTPASSIRSFKALARLVVTLDDAGEGGQAADLRVNVLYHAAGAVTDPAFIALRPEFQAAHGLARIVREPVRELLIVQGGSDTYGFTPRIIAMLAGLRIRPHATVVLGAAFRHEAALRLAVQESPLDLTVIRNAPRMAELMLAADLAITAGGLTMFELACVGTPSLIVCAERFEVETAGRLEAAGAVECLGFGEDVAEARLRPAVETLAGDLQRRQRMSACGMRLVDGRGCLRIVQLVKQALVTAGSAR